MCQGIRKVVKKMQENGKVRGICYKTTTILAEVEDNGLCRLYGIVGTDASGGIVAEIADISSSKDTVENLVRIMNTKEVSCDHFKYVVEDYIAML